MSAVHSLCFHTHNWKEVFSSLHRGAEIEDDTCSSSKQISVYKHIFPIITEDMFIESYSWIMFLDTLFNLKCP